MKKKNLITILGVCALTFAVSGGFATASSVANAEAMGVVSVSENQLFIDGTQITAENANFETWHKASIRYDATKVEVEDVEYEQTGMRFLSWLDKDIYAALMASEDYTLTLGTIIANESRVEAADDFTKEALVNTESATLHLDVKADKVVAQENQQSGEANVEEFSAVLYGISDTNYTTARMARAYMTVTSTTNPEESVTIYATRTTPAEGESAARSVADVAYRALESSQYDFTDEEFEVKYASLCDYAQKYEEWATYLNEEEQEVPYTYMAFVDTVDELTHFAPNADTCIKLIDDIDASSAVWTTRSTAKANPNCAILVLNADLDGNGKKIKNATVSTPLPEATEDNGYDSNFGFFGTIKGRVSNLLFEGSLGAIDGTTLTKDIVSDRAGLFAWKNEGVIENCYIKGAIYNYHPQTSHAAMSIGVVFMNEGTMKNVMTDLYTATACSATTVRAERYGFAFAVSNTGTVENCVTVTSQYEAEIGSGAGGSGTWIRSRTTSGFGVAYDEATGQYTWVKHKDVLAGGNVGVSFPNTGVYTHSYGWGTAIWADVNRDNCYIFHRYDDLLSDMGVGYNDDYKVALPTTSADLTDENKKASNTYTKKTGADGKAALGSAWTFTADSVLLAGRVVYSK